MRISNGVLEKVYEGDLYLLSTYNKSEEEVKADQNSFWKGVKTVGEYAFCNLLATTFANLEIPSSVTKIEEGAFAGFNSTVPFSLDLTNVQYIGERAFADSYFAEIKLSDNLEYIGDEAFKNAHVDSVVIPGSVKKLGDNVFASSTINKIELQEGVEFIGDKCFEYCTASEVILPDSLKMMGKNTFYNSARLKKVKLPNNLEVLEKGTFANCRNLTEIIIPNSVVEIGEEAFLYCTDLQSVALPEKLKKIGPHAFARCVSITQIQMPQNVTEIGNFAFSDCVNLTQIQIPESVVEIGSFAFSGCEKLESVELPDNIVKLAGTFKNCEKLTSVKLPKNLQELGFATFENCVSLKNIEIPESVTTLSGNCFKGCLLLDNVNVPENVRFIGSNCFQGCKSLTNITIPKKTTLIGENCFQDCTNLTSVTIHDGVRLSGNVFEGCANLKYVNVIKDDYVYFIPVEDINSITENNESVKIEIYYNEKYTNGYCVINNKKVELKRMKLNEYQQEQENQQPKVKPENIVDNSKQTINNQTNTLKQIFSNNVLSQNSEKSFSIRLLVDNASKLYQASENKAQVSQLNDDLQNVLIESKNGNIVASVPVFVNREKGYMLIGDTNIEEKYKDNEEAKSLIVQQVSKVIKDCVNNFNAKSIDGKIEKVIKGKAVNFNQLKQSIENGKLNEVIRNSDNGVSVVFDNKSYGKEM